MSNQIQDVYNLLYMGKKVTLEFPTQEAGLAFTASLRIYKSLQDKAYAEMGFDEKETSLRWNGPTPLKGTYHFEPKSTVHHVYKITVED